MDQSPDRKKLSKKVSLIAISNILAVVTPWCTIPAAQAQHSSSYSAPISHPGGNHSSTAINRPIADKWALVIGVSKFQDPTIPQLRFAAKDAQDFANFLVKEQNFAPDHV